MKAKAEPKTGVAIAGVLRRGWAALAMSVALSYVLLMVGTLVAANVSRGLAWLETGIFGGPGDALPVWTGVAIYFQGVALVAGTALLSLSALLAASVELTRSIRAGERVRPWTPFRRGLTRVPAVSVGLLLLVPRLLALVVATAVLILASVVTVPVAALTGIAWLVRPSWRKPWMRRPLLLATPFGVLLFAIVRWALWLPFVVVDRAGARSGLRASRAAIRAHWWSTARPLVGVLIAAVVGAAGVGTLAESDISQSFAVLAAMVVTLLVLAGFGVTATVLYEGHAGTTPGPGPRLRDHLGFFNGLRPSPALVIGLLVCLSTQTLWITQDPASAADPTPDATFVVNSAGDSLTPDLGVECRTPADPCTLRGAVAQARVGGFAAPRITFDIDGATVTLAGPLHLSSTVAIDGVGDHVTLQNPSGSVVVVSAPSSGGGDGGGSGPPGIPGPITLRNLTIAGTPGSHESGLHIGSGTVNVENALFRNHDASDILGAAIHNAGTLTVTNTTFADNSGFGPEGGTVWTFGYGPMVIVNSTFVGNHGGAVGGNIIGNPAFGVTIANSVFLNQTGFNCMVGPLATYLTTTGNRANDGTCTDPFADDYDTNTGLSNLDLAIEAVQDNGGPVATAALEPSSVAIGAGDPNYCPATDARGVARPSAPDPCDAGAFQASTGTTTTVSTLQSSAPFGSPVHVTVTVHHAHALPTGTVELTGVGGAPQTATLGQYGTATFTVDGLTVGAHTLTATYHPAPGSLLEPSTGTLGITVGQQQSASALTVEPAGQSLLGDPVALTAVVTNSGDGSGAVPTGTVTFKADGTSVGTAPLANGQAVLSGVVLAGGLRTLTATYGGSAGFVASTSSDVTHAVKSATEVTLTAPTSSTYGQPITLSGSVSSPDDPDGPVATGTVLFDAVNVAGLGSATLGVTGTFSAPSTTVLPVGEYDLRASYQGDPDHAGGYSDPVHHTVLAADTTTALTGPAGATTFGQPAAFTATVSPVGTPAVPTGTVDFRVGNTVAATVNLVNGTATWTPTGLTATPVGWHHMIVAIFQPGDGNFTTSQSATLHQTVGQAATTSTLSAPATSVTGQPIVLTATVTATAPSEGVPTGTVSFFAGTTLLGTAPLADGAATYSVDDLAVGPHVLTARFAGTADLLASDADAVNHTVARAATDVAVTANPNPPTHGQAITLFATVTPADPGGGIPTGAATFLDGSTPLGTATLDAGGVAILAVGTLPAGDRALSAAYAGDGGYLAGTGNLTLAVAKAVPTVAVGNVSPTPSHFGSPVTFTVTVQSPTGSTPTGDVAFYWGGSGPGNQVGQSPLSNGVATFTTSSLNIARTIVVAQYLGDANHAAVYTPQGSDNVLTWHQVLPAASYPIDITTEPGSTTYGEKIKITADMGGPINGQIPSGLVRIRVQNHNGDPGVTQFNSAGKATWEVTGVAPGARKIVVTVDSDFYFAARTVEYDGHTVTPGTATVTLAADPAGAVAGSPTTLTATLAPGTTAGIGKVDFYSAATGWLGEAPVDLNGRAGLTTTFAVKGPQTVTAVYNGFGFFNTATSAPLTVTVAGRALNLVTFPSAAGYGENAKLDATLWTPNATPPAPTGTVSVMLGDHSIATLAVPAGSGGLSGLLVLPMTLSLGTSQELGTHDVTVVYSGDSVYAAVSATSSFTIGPRTVEVRMDPHSPATAGEPVHLSGRVVLPAGLSVPPTGTLTLGIGGGQTCVITLSGGLLGGGCTVVYNRTSAAGEWLLAEYSGDTHYAAGRSSTVELKIGPAGAYIELDPGKRLNTFDDRVWTDTEAAPITWKVQGTGTATPPGTVEVWTNEGRQSSCPRTLTGSCDVRFRTASDAAWVEVRYSGGGGFDPTTERATGPVFGCFNVTVFTPGKTTTAPNCGQGRYLQGTSLALDVTPPAGYKLAGWSFGATDGQGRLDSSPVFIRKHSIIEPRFEPVCFTLTADVLPYNMPRAAPEPAPNCDDLVAPNHALRDLDAIRKAEVASGAMRYRTGTKVTVPTINIGAAIGPKGSELVSVRWSGDGLGTDRKITLDQNRRVLGELVPPCQKFVVSGPPGATVKVISSSLDVSKSQLLRNYGSGACTRPDGTPGYITHTRLRVSLTPAEGTWFTGWSAVGRLSQHEVPSLASVTERPANYAAGAAVTTVDVPGYDAAISGSAAGVSCFEVKVGIKDGVDRGLRVENTPGPSVTTSPVPNCPAWWLNQRGIYAPSPQDTNAAPLRWYLAGTQVTVKASATAGKGYTEEFVDPKTIEFRRFTGGLTGERPEQTVTVSGTIDTTAEWYIPAQCARIVVRGRPAGDGDVLTSDLGTACPTFQSQYSSAPTAQVPLGTEVSLVARPHGSLQTIWQVEGTSVINTEECRRRELDLNERYEMMGRRGVTGKAADEQLMALGYLPGYTMARIEKEAAAMFAKGWTQDNILHDLKLMGLLDANGRPVADQLRPNPCDKVIRDTVIPAGQRIISTNVDGHLVATAWFCQAVVPAVTVIDVDGTTHSITGSALEKFAPLFTSTTGNCPTPGWYLPGTTATFGAPGTTVAGYKIEGWTVDGKPAPAGPLSLPMRADDPARNVGVTVRVQCHQLSVRAEFGVTVDPKPNCPFADASRNLYMQGTKVTVTAGESSNHVWLGWHETKSMYNPVPATMTAPVNLTANFRAKTVGEQITSTVIDPAINAMGVAAKKVVGGVAFTIKGFSQLLIEDGLLSGLSLIGTGLKAGFGALGVQGKVLDGIVVGLQTPKISFEASLAGFDCIEQWAWGRSVPTLDDLKDMATSTVSGAARNELLGADPEKLLFEARQMATDLASGDPEALAMAAVAASGGGQAAAVFALAKDINANPAAWEARARDAGNYALERLAEELGKPFTWESSASEAWTSGGDEFLKCMADNGKKMAGQ